MFKQTVTKVIKKELQKTSLQFAAFLLYKQKSKECLRLQNINTRVEPKMTEIKS